jgi:predicted nuclease of predicted toxin-antitoxin system
MRILLDESVPQKLRLLIEGHAAVTVAFQGWSGLKNGDLLTVAEEEGYDLLITADQEITYQQNLSSRKLSLIVLSTNNWDQVKASAHRILAAIAQVTPGSYAEVKIPWLDV